MAKPEWGTKRQCQSCGAKYYDFGRSPIVCPACGTTFDPEAILKARRPRPGAAPKKERVVPIPGDEPEAVPEAAEDEVEEAVVEEAEAEVVEGEEVAEEAELVEEEDDLMEDTSELGEDDEDVEDIVEDGEAEEER